MLVVRKTSRFPEARLHGEDRPVCFRYVISPKESKVTNVFKPQVAAPEPDAEPGWRHQTIGGVFVGNMNEVISNKRASIVWEARQVSLRTR